MQSVSPNRPLPTPTPEADFTRQVKRRRDTATTPAKCNRPASEIIVPQHTTFHFDFPRTGRCHEAWPGWVHDDDVSRLGDSTWKTTNETMAARIFVARSSRAARNARRPTGCERTPNIIVGLAKPVGSLY